MNKEEQLKKINTELKIYINESSFISNSCRNKIIRLLGNKFKITLPIENFKNVDLALLEDGSIVMRDEVYKQEMNLSYKEVLERYEEFKEEADNLLKRKSKNTFMENDKSNSVNLFIVLLISGLFIALVIYTLKSFFTGNFIQCIWLFIFLTTWLLPSIRDRFSQAFNYIKRKMKR
mgnify:FL=1